MAAASPAAAVLASRRLCRPLAQAAARQRKGWGRAAAAARVPPPESPDAGGDAGANYLIFFNMANILMLIVL
ncbi:hypothetical protein OsJ_10449 [Oryza sativa Japonica Group]|uniref:Uncharacterized protein n=1 Tax=Oryza sativa subsp. japonica TaxID=39947 RepID=A3AGW4_ORYSJ|nr:hypothetical protein OsJ_10449 [Oryza sativa Japonica Group]